MRISLASLLLPLLLSVTACGDDGSEADRRGVGAQCAVEDDCTEEDQSCLTQFKGGYCGVMGCTADVDCPAGSACVTHEDTMNYCFLICVDKDDCNVNRDLENESNCSSNATFVDGTMGRKACVPPSGA
jgi:hypothetical protein